MLTLSLSLLSVTRRRNEGILNLIDREEEDSTEATSSAFSSPSASSSRIPAKVSLLLLVERSGILIDCVVVVVNGGARDGPVGRGGREGARSLEPGVDVDPSSSSLSFASAGVSPAFSASSFLSISTSSASRYHFLLRVHRPQPSWPRRPFCHCGTYQHQLSTRPPS